MQLVKLDDSQIRDIYYKYLVNDFPDNELKPIEAINDMLSRKIYDCFALISDSDKEKIYGYVYCVRTKTREGNIFLIDYLAVTQEYRNQGFGSKMLQLLKKSLVNPVAIICEVENPDYSDGEEKDIQNRRISFYLRNGFNDTGATECLYFVEYKLLDMTPDGQTVKNAEQTIHNVDIVYRDILPQYIYDRHLKYHN